MTFDGRETLILAIVVLFLGKKLNQRIRFLRTYNIPEPVTGGLVASFLCLVIYVITKQEVEFELSLRDIFLVLFFTSIGVNARLSELVKGGKSLVILLVLVSIYLFLQNGLGVIVMSSSGSEIPLGIMGGSISFSGGHGTAIAWAPIFQDSYGIGNALEIGVACATFGLVVGGIFGGPVANFLIKKHNLKSTSQEDLTVGVVNEYEEPITSDRFMFDLMILGLAIGIGSELFTLLNGLGIQIPLFVTCLFGGIILTNTVPYIFKDLRWPSGKPTLALISDVSLGLFLSMSLMSLQLWTLVDLELPFIILMILQVVMCIAYSVFVIYRALGKNYDAAIMSSGFFGLTMGATPTAMVNMSAITQKLGASPQSFVVIPLVGAFFLDIVNAFVIQIYLNWIT